MRDKLTAQGQARSLLDERPTGMREEEWTDLCSRVCSEIRLHLSDEIQMQVLGLTTSQELWKYLQKRYLNTSTSSRMHAKHKLWSCMMKDGEDLAAHVQRFTSLSCEIVALGDEPMNDEDKAFMLLRSLPNSLEHLVQTLMYGKERLTFDDVYSALLSEDSRKMVGKTKKDSSTALSVERGRTQDRKSNTRGGSKGRSKSRGRSDRQNSKGSGSGAKQDLECWKCGKKGHMKRDCRGKAKVSESTSSEANVATGAKEADLLYDDDEEHVL